MSARPLTRTADELVAMFERRTGAPMSPEAQARLRRGPMFLCPFGCGGPFHDGPCPPVLEYLKALGRKGGKARMTTMTQKQRSASASKASRARWSKRGALLMLVFLTGVQIANAAAEPTFTITPESRTAIVMQAYQTLPPRLREALRDNRIDVTFFTAAGKDANGDANTSFSLPVAKIRLWWPAGIEAVGMATQQQAMRHELAHVALHRLSRGDSYVTATALLNALRKEDQAWLSKATGAHADLALLRGPDIMKAYGAMDEYLAVLAETCGTTVRMPLPTNPLTRQMVERLVTGGCEQ